MSRISVEIGVRKWICMEPNDGGDHPKPVVPLSQCKHCSKQQKRYGAYYNAAAHLRRVHFQPKSKGRRKNDVEERRGGKGGGDWPPMSELKLWMRELRAIPRTFKNATDYRRKMVAMSLNDTPCFARPDTGSDRNIITAAFAADLGVEIIQRDDDSDQFVIGNGQYTASVGKALVSCKLLGYPYENSHWFYVMAKCSEPVIVGFDFVREIELYTEKKHLLVDCTSAVSSIPSLTFMGSPKGRVQILADGQRLEACVDTGSDLDLMSAKCTSRNGFKIDRSKRNYVMLADETIVETLGQVRVKSVQLPESYPALYEQADLAIGEDSPVQEVDQADILSTTADDMEEGMIFHVLGHLVCDVILGEEFLEQMDAFNTCGFIERDSDDYDYDYDAPQSGIPLYTSEKFPSLDFHFQNTSSHQYSFANHGQPSDHYPMGYPQMGSWIDPVDIIEPAYDAFQTSSSVYTFASLEQPFDLPQDLLPMEPFRQTSNSIRTSPSLDSLFDLPSFVESPELHSLNPFVNLGPVQSFLNKLRSKNKLKSSTTGGQLSGNVLALARKEHAEIMEAEMYRHNNAERVMARMKNKDQKEIAQKAENGNREAFRNGHVGCAHCTSVATSSSSVCGISGSGSSSQVV